MMEEEGERRTVIGPWTAALLYGLLIGAAFWTLRGKALILALIIVGALAAKSFVHWLREKAEQ
jgi:hypothetical protein